MKRYSIIVIAIIILAIFSFTNLRPQSPQTPSPNPTPKMADEKVNITATFTIITDSITRSFKAEKYHNKSPDVYIEASDPTIVHVTKSGTWDNFFKTLPMELTRECLITGDGETLCDGKDGSLKFYLNDVETPDLLEKQIKEGDKVLIKFISF